jgi:uncharacterized damage-inducible protein DinB
MDVGLATDRLAANAEVFAALVRGVDQEQALWRPSEETWSILEVVNHLADEDAEDFRARIDLTLHRPGEPWPPNRPAEWPQERSYRERSLQESIDRFVEERARSVAWLRGLRDPDLECSFEHPPYPPIRAGDLLAAWLAHDLIHIRQITRLHFEYLELRAAPYRVEYAGRW